MKFQLVWNKLCLEKPLNCQYYVIRLQKCDSKQIFMTSGLPTYKNKSIWQILNNFNLFGSLKSASQRIAHTLAMCFRVWIHSLFDKPNRRCRRRNPSTLVKGSLYIWKNTSLVQDPSHVIILKILLVPGQDPKTVDRPK
jgi:hypothetical protein